MTAPARIPPKHPGSTKAQRRILDQIGSGNYSPMMAKATCKALLDAGLIVKCGEKIFGKGPLAVRVDEYEMPIPVHMQWCAAMAHDYDKSQDVEK